MELVKRNFILQRLSYFLNTDTISRNYSLVEERITLDSPNTDSGRVKLKVLTSSYEEIQVSDGDRKLIKRLKANNGCIEIAENVTINMKEEILSLESIFDVDKLDSVTHK